MWIACTGVNRFKDPSSIDHTTWRISSGTAALVGRSAIVLEEVTEHSGRICIGGEEWSSRPYDESLVIPVGAKVDVMQIDGATALVYPRE